MNPTCSVIVVSDDNASNVVEYVEKVSDGIVVHNPGGQTIILQDFNSISPTTPTSSSDKVSIATFNAYTGETQIHLNQIDSEILHISGATSGLTTTYIASGGTILNKVGQTLTIFSPYPTGIITGASNGIIIINKKVKLGGFLDNDTTIDLNTNNLCLINGNVWVSDNMIAGIFIEGGLPISSKYLGISGTSICSISAINSKALCGCIPNCFLGATACASDSAKLDNKLPAYYLNTGSTALCAITAKNALCLNGISGNSYQLKTDFNYYTGTTIPNTYYNKTQINSYTGQTLTNINSRLLTTIFTTYTGTTIPNTYYNKTQINNYTGTTNTNINSRLLTTIFATYTGTTIPNTYYNKTQINSYTGTTNTNINSRLLKTDFNTFTGTTLPTNYYNKTQINSYSGQTLTNINSRLLTTIFVTYTGTTVPANYYNKTQINHLTGTTLPNTYLGISATAVNSFALCGCIPSCFLGATACAVDSAKLGNQLPSFYMPATVGLTGGTNGIGTISQNACLGGTLISNTCIIGNQALCLGISVNKLATLDLHTLGEICIESGNLLISSSGATFTDLNAIACGIVYNADYSTNYVPRSLVDKGYVDSIAAGLNVHLAVVAATTSGITLSGSPKYIDGVYLTNGMRVLVKNQGTVITGSPFNGIYVVTGTTWSRSSDYSSSPQVSNGDLIPVTSGSTQNSSLWALASANPITVGVTPLIFTEFSTIIDVQAGVGIAVTQLGGIHTVCVQLGTCSSSGCGLAVNANGLCVNSSIAGSGLTYNTGILTVNAAMGGVVSAISVKLNTSCQLVVNCADISGVTSCNSLALCGCIPSCFLGATSCAVDSAKLGTQLPAYYLNTGSTAINSLALCGCIPACFLGATACAVDSAKLGTQLPAYYLNTGSTAINSLALCGCTPACFLGTTACAVDSAKLGTCLPAYYLNTGSTAINSLALCGCTPACFLGATACAVDSAKLGTCLPAYYLNTGSTACNSLALCGCIPSCFLGATSCAVDSAKLGTCLPAYYLNTGSTAICAVCAIGAKSLCGCVPASFLLSGGTAVCATTAINALCLGSCLASCYQQKADIITYTGTTAPATYMTLLAPILVKTGTTYTLQTSDSGKILEFTNTGTTNITLPSGATLAIGFQVVLTNVGGGNKCVLIQSPASLHSLCSHVIIAGAYNAATVYYRCTNNWVLFGNLC